MSAREKELERALADLHSEVALVRKQAIRTLGRLGEARALSMLRELAANDAEERVRHEAREAADSIALSSPDLMPAGLSTEATAIVRTREENAAALDHVRKRTDADAMLERLRLVEDAMRGTEAKLEARAWGWKIVVPLLDDRQQKVRVIFDHVTDSQRDKVIVIHSPCAPARPELYRWALELNHRLTYGRLAIEHDEKEGDRFVLAHALLEATADPIELKKAILSVAEKADWVEKMLSQEDRY